MIDIDKFRLGPDDLHFILLSLSQQELLALVQSIGIVFSGVRPAKLNAGELATALADDFFKSADARAMIAEALDKKLPPVDLSFLLTKEKYRAFKKGLDDYPPKDMAALLWTLSKDPRPEAAKALDAALETFDDRLDELDEHEMAEHIKGLVDKSKAAEDLERRLQETQQAEKQKEKRIGELARGLEDEKKRYVQAQVELTRAKERERALEARLRDKEQELSKARHDEASAAELAKVRERLAQLEAELRLADIKLRRQGRLKRVGLFVDAQNLIISCKEAFGAGLDFSALYRKVEECGEDPDRLIVFACAYLAEDPLREPLGLKAAMRRAGFEVKTRPIIYRADGTSKGNWDLGMAVEVMEKADRLDVVVVGTGDSDFEDLVRYLKEKRPHLTIEVAAVDSAKHTSERLLQAADRVHRLGPRQALPQPKTSEQKPG